MCEMLKYQFVLLTLCRIRHFAGQVSYAATGFMEKNTDKLPRHIGAGFFQSKLLLMQSLFPEGWFCQQISS